MSVSDTNLYPCVTHSSTVYRGTILQFNCITIFRHVNRGYGRGEGKIDFSQGGGLPFMGHNHKASVL